MINVNVHEAKTQLSKLLFRVEHEHQTVTVCRNGRPVAEIVPIKAVKDPFQRNPALKPVLKYDPTEPLADDELPWEV